MKLDYINKKKELMSIVLFGISVLFAVLITTKIVSHYKLYARAQKIEDITQTMIAKDCNKPEELDKYLNPIKEIANNLKKNNLFAPPQPKKNPVTQVQSILGDEVFINNKWYKEGDMVQDAKIVSLEPTQVTIEWEGKKTVLQPLGATTASNGSNENAPPKPENIITSESGRVAIASPALEQFSEGISSPKIDMMEPPQQEQLPDEIKNVIENLNIPNLNPEMLQKMTDEQKEQLEKMIRARTERN